LKKYFYILFNVSNEAMSNSIKKCLLKLPGSSTKIVQEVKQVQEVKELKRLVEEDDEEEEEELCFTKITIQRQNANDCDENDYDEPDYDEPNYDEPDQDEKYMKQQNKIGLMCNCGLATILREVKKDGPNQGKMFYTCSNNFEEKCNYFMWKDDSDKKIGKNPTVIENKTIVENKTAAENKSEFEEIDYKHQQKIGKMCYCKLASVSREVKKDGPTKGKIFYVCSKYYDDKCKYFVWKDELK
jgi:hypothetical protein